MRIIYVAKFDQPYTNDDEGAIAHALRVLGHDVQCVREVVGHRSPRVRGDLVLFHKWDSPLTLQQFKCPKVFWYFDLVDWPSDSTLAGRCKTRKDWMTRIIPHVDLGFCTDGDWVAANPEKLVWLPQGVDTRVAGPGMLSESHCTICKQKIPPSPILFTGISRGGGDVRMAFVDEMTEVYGDDFRHIQVKVHGRDLANLIANSKIVVCPDSPVTDRYWSNRVYLMMGFKAFVLHPYCRELSNHYANNTDILYYRSREELHTLIRNFSKDDSDTVMNRNEIAMSGYRRTIREHTYVERCRQLIATVKERLKL